MREFLEPGPPRRGRHPRYNKNVAAAVKSRTRFSLVVLVFASLMISGALTAGQPGEPVSTILRDRQYDLTTDGRAFLIKEAANASFFLIGELHGDNETPALIRAIWPALWEAGYRHVAAELSPWMADHLSHDAGAGAIQRMGSWSRVDMDHLSSVGRGGKTLLWGCDIEEVHAHLLIRQLAAANPTNEDLRTAAEISEAGYQRRLAPISRVDCSLSGDVV